MQVQLSDVYVRGKQSRAPLCRFQESEKVCVMDEPISLVMEDFIPDILHFIS